MVFKGLNSNLFFLGAVFCGIESGLNTTYVCILGEERDALSSWPFLSRVFTYLKEIMLYRRRAGRQVDVPADDREGAALH